MNASETMRALLAHNGIFLDDEPAISPAPEPATTAPIDREAIREVLLERGVPMRELDWLVGSCPSMEAALSFVPTPWMLRDDDFTDYLDERPLQAGKGTP